MVKSSPKDVFLQLLTVAALYFCAFNFTTLVFKLIETGFPDPLNQYYDFGSSVRWSIASLIIIFPVYLWAARFLHRDMAANPEKADLKIKKWLLYFTLFAAAVLIIGDLVALIFNFLEGELTIRFSLKILAILAVAASVFGYYLYELKRKPADFSARARIFVWAVIVAVVAVVVAGFFVAGSPFKQRQIKFDRERVGHLQGIQWQIVNFWQQKERLPAALDELRDPISGYNSPLDPETRNPYEYRSTGALSFELCANFNLPAEETPDALRPAEPAFDPFGKPATQGSWAHTEGRNCFERDIDPEIYKIKGRTD